MERICQNCYYSKPSKNSDLVVCTYMNDIMSHGEILDSPEEWKTARYFTKLTNFSGDAFKAYDMSGTIRICVDKDASCGKWVESKGKSD